MKSGKLWVLGLFALGILGGTVAVTHWSRPENSVRGSFTQIHAAILRGNRKAALRLLAARIAWQDREHAPAEFLEAYGVPPQVPEIDVRPCPSVPAHMTVIMAQRVYCFILDGRIWKLHAVREGVCRCK